MNGSNTRRPELSDATRGIVENAFRADGQVYVCPFCEYSCLNKVNFECHVITHTGERPYRCSLCSKGFTQKHNLQYHMLIHRGLKPFKCATCSQGFRRSYCLKMHREKHQH
ncbi:hypothetical protein JTE90_005911 [Oedothorax gibbosus]|uniref:C2H2-type domain-containing protein n=1 Tax=Oedothorax gibbosus TaxID=931172 RepID=A0AAV6U9E9_9ARAC|nr:hypothetical protein JTE90_005911 [Oedothorax gibbosus]